MPVKKENKIPFLKWLADVKRTHLKVLPIKCEPSCQTQGKRIDNLSNGYRVFVKTIENVISFETKPKSKRNKNI